MEATVYKVLRVAEFAAAQAKGRYKGSADDRRDGFIHLSSAGQLEGTLAKHFAGERDLVLLALDAARLGPLLRWEPSRGGALFPHLYARLDLASVLWSEEIELGAEGVHRLPAKVLP
jgi:uncharacterized protein (DUF952 family)